MLLGCVGTVDESIHVLLSVGGMFSRESKAPSGWVVSEGVMGVMGPSPTPLSPLRAARPVGCPQGVARGGSVRLLVCGMPERNAGGCNEGINVCDGGISADCDGAINAV